jgi:SSS family solute:Na+ symporter
MVIGGVLVTLLGLSSLGDGEGVLAGWQVMIERNLGTGDAWAKALAESGQKLLKTDTYNRLSVFQPLNHPITPWVTIFTAWLSISIWYNCINQFMVQRVLAAKDDWHARMGIVFSMFMKIFLPLIIVIPGLIYFAMNPGITDQKVIDQTYPVLVTTLVHTGLKGLLLAALFGAIQSTVDSVLNATSTIITLDLYKKFLKPDADEPSLARMGKYSSAAVLVFAAMLAPFIERLGQGVFVYVQNLYAHFAPPFAAIFLVGILWKRANGFSAIVTIVIGILASILIQISTEMSFTLRATFVWAFCVYSQVTVSLATEPPPEEKTTSDLVADWGSLQIFNNLGTPWHQNLLVWYSVAACGMVSCYVVFSGLLF